MDNSFRSLIDSANSILILLPSKPYFDQVAAGLALYLAVRNKKEVGVSCPDEMVVEFNRLVGVNKVTSQTGNKNLTVKFVDYKASDIERVSYDVENGEFRLTVIPKPGFSAPKKEQINLSFAGVSADTIVLIGGGNETHFPTLATKELSAAKVIHIGTRNLNISGLSIMSFARPASSTSEVAFGLIEQSGLDMDADIATNLLMGIEEGSKEFKGPEVTAETFETVAKLLKSGGRRQQELKSEKRDYPLGAVPGAVVMQEPEKKEETPKDWLEPKIYKGTSVS
jgi:hypothetical protein